MSEPTPLLKPLAAAVTAPQLWKAGRFAADAWRALADDEPLPPDAHVLVSLARWRAERGQLDARLKAGILLQPGDQLDPETDALDRLAVVALAFPRFSDGRPYSTARRLREQWGYRGEIRATGDVLLDQLPLMQRAGFDAFVIVNAATIKALRAEQAPAVSRSYQSTAASGGAPWRSRAAEAEAA